MANGGHVALALALMAVVGTGCSTTDDGRQTAVQATGAKTVPASNKSSTGARESVFEKVGLCEGASAMSACTTRRETPAENLTFEKNTVEDETTASDEDFQDTLEGKLPSERDNDSEPVRRPRLPSYE